MKKYLLFILILFTSLLSGCGFQNLFTNDQIDIETLNHISTVILSANVKITTETYDDFLIFETPGPYKGSGSGAVFYQSGGDYYVLTNKHVVRLDDHYQHRYTIEDINGNVYRGNLYMVSEGADLAVLWFNSKEKYHTASFSDTNTEVGDIVFSVGSPSGQQNIITAGKILEYKKAEQVDYEIIFHNAIIKQGSSGGMLINKDGEIVGLNTWGFPSAKDSEEEFVNGGAIPTEKILEFLVGDELFKNLQ